jgi:hypothetical protein
MTTIAEIRQRIAAKYRVREVYLAHGHPLDADRVMSEISELETEIDEINLREAKERKSA